MEFKMNHTNINVTNMSESLKFYNEALGLKEISRKIGEDFIIVFLGDGITPNQLELTWLKNKKDKYDLGDNETHIAFKTNNKDEAYKHHQKMNCICFENKEMNIYFIEDPDGYWLEII